MIENCFRYCSVLIMLLLLATYSSAQDMDAHPALLIIDKNITPDFLNGDSSTIEISADFAIPTSLIPCIQKGVDCRLEYYITWSVQALSTADPTLPSILIGPISTPVTGPYDYIYLPKNDPSAQSQYVRVHASYVYDGRQQDGSYLSDDNYDTVYQGSLVEYDSNTGIESIRAESLSEPGPYFSVSFGAGPPALVPEIDEEDLTDGESASPATVDVWFTPNVASVDMRDLFDSGVNQWPAARNLMDVFGFYTTQIDSHPSAENNNLANLRAAGAFSDLKAWGKKIALHTHAVKCHSCLRLGTQQSAIDTAKRVIDKIQAPASGSGILVNYIAMDEPYRGGSHPSDSGPGCPACNQTFDQTVTQTFNYIQAVRALYPSNPPIIGDIEPYPLWSRTQLETWIDALDDRLGTAGLPFFQLDVDRTAGNYNQTQAKADIQALKTYCQDRGIQFGVIFQGRDGTNNDTYYDDVSNWVKVVKNAIGTPTLSSFQSWAVTGGTSRVPDNISECEPNTHTRLINDSYLFGSGNNAQFITQVVPAGPWLRGSTKTISVTFKNTGNTTWQFPNTFGHEYFLDYVPPVTPPAACPNSPPQPHWGGVDVPLPPGECIAPGQTVAPGRSYTFTFNIAVPSTAGAYNLNWKMKRRAPSGTVSEFGGASNPICRTVQ